MDLVDTYIIIKGYAWLCTLPRIDSLARAALSTGAEASGQLKPSASLVPPPPPHALAPAPGVAGASVIAPQITVNR